MINSLENDVASNDLLLKRLRYRSGHRGCKETDIVFDTFCEAALQTLSPALLAAYGRLLDENDADIWRWLTEKEAPPEDYTLLLGMMKKALLVASC